MESQTVSLLSNHQPPQLPPFLEYDNSTDNAISPVGGSVLQHEPPGWLIQQLIMYPYPPLHSGSEC